MKDLKRAYYYLFYSFYRFWEKTSCLKFLSDWKSVVCIGTLEIWFILSLGIYYTVITKDVTDLSFKMPIVFVPFLIIVLTKYFVFVHTDVWKDYVKEFDKLPKEQNRKGSWIVFAIVVFVISNLIFSFYLMSQIDWSKYR
ncbi:hypothetical protein [Sphingobacterium siyangense]|uniref:hypothetical protein n=1 Tax=Sphingobacterium siyangense TaxID=459529 RepID=UPI003DA25E33